MIKLDGVLRLIRDDNMNELDMKDNQLKELVKKDSAIKIMTEKYFELMKQEDIGNTSIISKELDDLQEAVKDRRDKLIGKNDND